jgi:hypothetical protein
MKFRLIGISLGSLLGIFLGMGTGVVGAFGGFQGVLVFGLLGAVMGFLAVPDVKRYLLRFRSKE